MAPPQPLAAAMPPAAQTWAQRPEFSKLQKVSKTNRSGSVPAQAENVLGYERVGRGVRKDLVTPLNTAPDSAPSLSVTALPAAPFADTRRPADFPGGS